MALRLPSIEPQPFESGATQPYTSTDVGGSGGLILAAAGNKMAESMYQLSAHLRQQEKEATIIAVTDAENGFAAEAMDLLHNANDGYLTTRNEAAIDTKPVQDKLAQLRSKWGSKLDGNGEGSRIYTQRTAARMTQYTAAVESHSAKQKYDYAKTVVNTAVETAQRGAQLNYNNPQRIENEFFNVLPVVESYLRSVEGISDEKMLKERLDVVRASIYGSVMQEFIDRGQGSQGLTFLKSKLANGETVEEALGAQGSKLIAKLRPLAAQEAGLALAVEARQDPKYNKTGSTDWSMVVNDLDAKWTASGTEFFGSQETYVAARNAALSFQSSDAQAYHTQRGTTLLQAKAFVEQNGVRSYAAFATAAPPALRDALKTYAADTEFQRWFTEKTENTPETPQQKRNFTEFLWRIADNEEAFSGLTPEQFESTVLAHLHRSHQDAARELVFKVMAQKGPVQKSMKEGLGLVDTNLRTSGALPLKSSMGPGAKDGAAGLSEEQQDIYNASKLAFVALFNAEVKNLGGKAPDTESIQRLARQATAMGRSKRPILPDKRITLGESIATGVAIDEFIPPARGTLAYNQYATAILQAREKEALRLEKAGKTAEAAAERAKGVKPEDVERLFRADMAQVGGTLIQQGIMSGEPQRPVTLYVNTGEYRGVRGVR